MSHACENSKPLRLGKQAEPSILAATVVNAAEEMDPGIFPFLETPVSRILGETPVAVRFTFSCGIGFSLGKALPNAPRFVFVSSCCGANLDTHLKRGFSLESVLGKPDAMDQHSYSQCSACGVKFPFRYPHRAKSSLSEKAMAAILGSTIDPLAGAILAPAIVELSNHWAHLSLGELKSIPEAWGGKPRSIQGLLKELP